MPPVYATSLLNSRLTDVVTAIDGGVTNASCNLYDAGNALIASLSLARPCGAAAGGVLTFSGMPWIDPSAAATGSPISARIVNSNGNQVTGLTVGTGSTSYDIVLSAATISSGQSVAITSAAITGR